MSTYLWDFGDDSPFVEGKKVNHIFLEPSPEGAPYRVTVTAIFEDDMDPPTEVTWKQLEVKSTPTEVDCPIDSITQQVFANSILVESQSEAGCIVYQIPGNFVNISDPDFEGVGEFHCGFSWEKLPAEAKVSAAYHISNRQEGATGGSEPRILLTPVAIGDYQQKAIIDVPPNSEPSVRLIMHIAENTSEEIARLELHPMIIEDISQCEAAELITRNPSANSSGHYIGFDRGTHVTIILRNDNCGYLQVHANSITISKNGMIVEQLTHQGAYLARGQEASRIWSTSSLGESRIDKGLYTIEIGTSEGRYVTWVIII